MVTTRSAGQTPKKASRSESSPIAKNTKSAYEGKSGNGILGYIERTKWSSLQLIALVVRLILIAYGAWQDNYSTLQNIVVYSLFSVKSTGLRFLLRE